MGFQSCPILTPRSVRETYERSIKIDEQLSVTLSWAREHQFTTGDMIDIILGMLPKCWVDKMVTTKIEPGNLTIKELVDHLENIEN